jgi:hypothetical protein
VAAVCGERDINTKDTENTKNTKKISLVLGCGMLPVFYWYAVDRIFLSCIFHSVIRMARSTLRMSLCVLRVLGLLRVKIFPVRVAGGVGVADGASRIRPTVRGYAGGARFALPAYIGGPGVSGG